MFGRLKSWLNSWRMNRLVKRLGKVEVPSRVFDPICGIEAKQAQGNSRMLEVYERMADEHKDVDYSKELATLRHLNRESGDAEKK